MGGRERGSKVEREEKEGERLGREGEERRRKDRRRAGGGREEKKREGREVGKRDGRGGRGGRGERGGSQKMEC